MCGSSVLATSSSGPWAKGSALHLVLHSIVMQQKGSTSIALCSHELLYVWWSPGRCCSVWHRRGWVVIGLHLDCTPTFHHPALFWRRTAVHLRQYHNTAAPHPRSERPAGPIRSRHTGRRAQWMRPRLATHQVTTCLPCATCLVCECRRRSVRGAWTTLLRCQLCRLTALRCGLGCVVLRGHMHMVWSEPGRSTRPSWCRAAVELRLMSCDVDQLLSFQAVAAGSSGQQLRLLSLLPLLSLCACICLCFCVLVPCAGGQGDL